MNRIWGGMELLCGALELAGASALLLTPEPTMLTKAGGGILMVHGSDTVSTGFRQLWSGEPEKTLTSQAATSLARDFGASASQAELVGQVVDTAVPLFAATLVAAERIAAVRTGRIVLKDAGAKPGVDLAEEEAAGGHTIERHIGKTEAELRARLAAEPGIPAATSFTTIHEAEEVISEALRANDASIRTWAYSGGQNKFAFSYSASGPVGYGVVRDSGVMMQMSKVRIVLRQTNIAGKVYFILTAYPQL